MRQKLQKRGVLGEGGSFSDKSSNHELGLKFVGGKKLFLKQICHFQSKIQNMGSLGDKIVIFHHELKNMRPLSDRA